MELKDLIYSDPEVLGGQTVFKGTRVPANTIFGGNPAKKLRDINIEN